MSQHEVLGHGHDRDQHEVLVHHADPEPDRGRRRVDHNRLSVDDDLALVGPVQAVEDRHQRRLAGAVLAKQRMHLTWIHVEVDSVVGDDRAELLRDAPQLKCGAERAGAAEAAADAWCYLPFRRFFYGTVFGMLEICPDLISL